MSEDEEYDEMGWSQIHHAAFNGYNKTIERLVKEKPTIIELETLDEQQVTPLWLAFLLGDICTVETLLLLGANEEKRDALNKGMVEVAIENQRINLIKHLMNKSKFESRIWSKLFEYYSPAVLEINFSGMTLLTASAVIIHELSCEAEYLQRLINYGVIEKIGKLYKLEHVSNTVELETCFSITVLNLISYQIPDIKVNENLFETLINRLILDNHDVHRVILSILKRLTPQVEFSKFMITKKSYKILIDFIEQTETDENIISTLEIIKLSLKTCEDIQVHLNKYPNFLPLLIKLLNHDNEDILKLALKILRHYVATNTSNQEQLAELDITSSIEDLLETQCRSMMAEICKLVSATASKNVRLQSCFMESEIIDKLVELFDKFKNEKLHVFIVKALWDIAGAVHQQKLKIACKITVERIIEFSTSNSSPSLRYYGFEMSRILVRLGQNELLKIGSSDITMQLAKILKPPSVMDDMVLSALRTIRYLCIDRGYRGNKVNQLEIEEEMGFRVLSQLFNTSHDRAHQLECLHTLIAMTLGRPSTWKDVKRSIHFTKNTLYDLLDEEDIEISFKTCNVLSLLVLQNKEEREELQKHIKLPFSLFDKYMNSSCEFTQITASFQMIVLRDFITSSAASSTALMGINFLTRSLANSNNDIVARSADFISGTALYCPGIRSAYVPAGLIEILCDLLIHGDEIVRAAVSVALVIISRCLNGEISLLNSCRRNKLIVKFIHNYATGLQLGGHFMKRWKHFQELNPI